MSNVTYPKKNLEHVPNDIWPVFICTTHMCAYGIHFICEIKTNNMLTIQILETINSSISLRRYISIMSWSSKTHHSFN